MLWKCDYSKGCQKKTTTLVELATSEEGNELHYKFMNSVGLSKKQTLTECKPWQQNPDRIFLELVDS